MSHFQPESASAIVCHTEHDHEALTARLLGARAFPGEPEAVSEARNFLRGLLARSPLIDDALLLTSEIATNAIKHTRSSGHTFAVTVLDVGHALRVEVVDAGGAVTAPEIRDDPQAICGRGLFLIANLASRWGTWLNNAGRTTWFELTLTRS